MTVNLTIDGTVISVPKGTTVYQACQKLEIDIPIFCYQDRMPPFGACRVCLVEVEKMAKLQTSCTLEAQEGMVVKTGSQAAVDGRQGILEFLLINHPLDCPICDRGGECPLQDQVLKFGPGQSRFYEEKRHFTKPLPLGPVLMLDRERCIVCARCTRFGEIVAGDHALEFIDRGYKTEVGTPNGETPDSKFIGNTIQICPVGALTSEVYRFRARPWDNEPTPTTCTLCPIGCSMILDQRDGEIMRTRSKENKEVNDIWLCDKGWFGYEFSSSPKRLQTPLIRKEGQLVEATWEEAIALVSAKMLAFKEGGKLAAFGGNPLTVEENHLFQQLFRKGCGVEHVDHAIGTSLSPLAGMDVSIEEIPNLKEIYLLGVDLSEEFPILWLKVKEAINRGAKVVFCGSYAPERWTALAEVHLHPPGKEVETLERSISAGAVFVGSGYIGNVHRDAILERLVKWRKEKGLSLNLLEGRGNAFGARLAGMEPVKGKKALDVLEEAKNSGWDLLYVAGANPARKFPSSLWKGARSGLSFLVVQDLFLTETAEVADVVLPTLSFVEKSGTFINIEGRVQRISPGKKIPENLLSDGEIFRAIARRLDLLFTFEEPFLKLLSEKRISRPFPEVFFAKEEKVEGGDLKAVFAPHLFDQGVRMEHNPHLIQLAKSAKIRLHPEEAAKRGLHPGERVIATAREVPLKGKIQLDPEVALGTAVFPVGFKELPVYEWAPLLSGVAVTVEREFKS